MAHLNCTSTSNSKIEALKGQEYDAQLLGFTISQFTMAVKTGVEEHVATYATAMKNSLVRRYPPNHPEIAEVEKRVQRLIKEYSKAATPMLTTLESQLTRVMHIPDYVLLSRDEVQRTQYSREAEEEVDSQLEDLYKRIQRVKVMEMELRHECKFLENLIPVLASKVDELEEITERTVDTEEDLLNIAELQSKIAIKK